MKTHLHPSVIYRVPQFPQNAEMEKVWVDFKKSIEISSKSFYTLIEDLNYEQIDSLPPGIRHTLWKYFNRAINRATPYNSFGAIGCVQLGNDHQIRVNNEQSLQYFTDWTYTTQYIIDFDELIQSDAMLFANSTYYRIGSEIRYVAKEDSGYELVDYPCSQLNLEILQHCALPVSISNLMVHLSEDYNTGMVLTALREMIMDQLLISSKHPNIIGAEYFKRSQIKIPNQDKHYIIAERGLVEGALDKKAFKDLAELIDKLHQFLPAYTSDDLEKFKEDFLRRFGDAQVPLMVALDPECGVSYSNLEEDSLTSDLINQLSTPIASNRMATNDQLLPMILGVKTESIDFGSISVQEKDNNQPLPNSISVLCTLADGLVQLEHTGGVTATSLLGRFTLANKKILTLCREMASIETDANPEVIFFDIAYLVGNNIDNVNRRESIYDYQLSLLNYDTSSTPLILNDISISIQGDQVILYSKSIKKRLVPRLTTAYNYLLSDLPVFRFLCDLQTQGVQKNLDLHLPSRIANLDYYPRLQFKNIIISPRTWRIRWNETFAETERGGLENFMEYLLEAGVSKTFRYGNGDQTLCFYLNRKQDMEQLLVILKKVDSLYVEEVISPDNKETIDQNGDSYQSQYILSLFTKTRFIKGVVH